MDWFEPTRTVLAARPRGAQRESAPGDPNSFTWTATHGSVVALMYGQVTVDGLNEVGLQANGLYLSESDYGARDVSRPGLGLQIALQFILDQFSTVGEAVHWIETSKVQIVPVVLGGKPGTGHLSIGDASGDCAIIEFIDGRTEIHHGREYTVMANSPTYAEQLRIRKRYVGLGGGQPLPGGTDSTDRFVRASYYSQQLPTTSSAIEATAEVFSVIRNASAPFGTVDENRPNVSTTRWRTVSDLTDLRYFFEWTMSPSLVWVDLTALPFDGDQDLVLDVENDALLSGDVTSKLAVR